LTDFTDNHNGRCGRLRDAESRSPGECGARRLAGDVAGGDVYRGMLFGVVDSVDLSGGETSSPADRRG
jgi:hypothetical protein